MEILKYTTDEEVNKIIEEKKLQGLMPLEVIEDYIIFGEKTDTQKLKEDYDNLQLAVAELSVIIGGLMNV